MNNRKILHFVTIGLFVTYLAVLVRIVLFKQAPLYNLLSAAGSSVRTISFIPFKSLYDMAISGTSIIRIIENILSRLWELIGPILPDGSIAVFAAPEHSFFPLALHIKHVRIADLLPFSGIYRLLYNMNGPDLLIGYPKKLCRPDL